LAVFASASSSSFASAATVRISAFAAASSTPAGFWILATRLATKSRLNLATSESRRARACCAATLGSMWKSRVRNCPSSRPAEINSADSSGGVSPPFALPLCTSWR